MIQEISLNSLMIYLVIILGQGHFLTAYFFGYKAGKMNTDYLRKFLIVFILSFCTGAYVYFNNQYLLHYILFVFTIFMVHFTLDEFKLTGLNFMVNKSLLGYSVASSFAALFYAKAFALDTQVLTTVLFFGYAALILFLYSNFKSILSNNLKSNLYLLYILAWFFAPVFLIYDNDISVEVITGVVIILHYIRWYIYYIQKLSFNPSKVELLFFLKIVFSINLLVLLTFIIYYINLEQGFFSLFFTQSFFYSWTLLHIIMSFSLSEFKLFAKS